MSDRSIVLGLSGGVDSAVTAALLIEAGYTPVGAYLDAGFAPPDDAAAVAAHLGIDFHVIDINNELETRVIAPFVADYASGRTPNPCVVCNPAVKFKSLALLADRLGAQKIATGHYARVKENGEEPAALFAARSDKDQSYVLYRLPQSILRRCVFPLGELSGKEAVREKARALSLPVMNRPDSMEICFVPGDDYGRFVGSRLDHVPPPGDFVDGAGRVLGTHRGIHHYTVGQRRGLGIAAKSRLFVKAIDAEKNQVILSDEDVYQKEIRLYDTVYLSPETAEKACFRCVVRVRYSKRSAEAVVWIRPGNRAEVVFDTPARAPAPGQSAVFYDGDRVIGGGVIE